MLKFFKSIFARIWAIWGMLSFIGTFLIFFLPSMATYLMKDPKGSVIFIAIARAWMNVWLNLVGCPVKVVGRSNFKPGEAYIVTCNHNSLMDIPLSSPFIPYANKTIAKTSFAKIPLFGWYYRKGSVLVDRNSDKSRRASLVRMRYVLRLGMHMCIYPEGTRNRSTQPLKKFYDGAFRLAVDTKSSIIPTLIFHTKKALPVNKPLYFLPHRLGIHFLEPVSSVGLKADELRDKVYRVMEAYYVAHDTVN